jgi:DNA polymerase III sliding clamp (beta) subunit (PCNA family)
MKVNRKNLVDCLEMAVSALGTNVLVPNFQYIQINGDVIQATDGNVLITTWANVESLGNFAVPRAFYDLLKNLTTEEVELIFKDDKLKVKTTKLVGTFTTVESSGIMEKNEIDAGYVFPESIPNFIEGLSFCRFGVSTDETSGSLCGIRIEGKYLYSTDRYRITKWELTDDLGFSCTLPVKFVDILLKHKNDISAEVGYVPSNNTFFAHFTNADIVTTVLPGDYQSLAEYFPKSSYVEVVFDGEQTHSLEKHVSFLKNVNPLDKELLVKIVNDTCIFISEDPESGILSEDVKILNVKDVELEFSVNPIFLKDIMNICSGFKYFPDNGLILFEADNLRYLVQIRK